MTEVLNKGPCLLPTPLLMERREMMNGDDRSEKRIRREERERKSVRK